MPSRAPRWCPVLILAGLLSACADASGPGRTQGDITILPNAVTQGNAGFSPNPLVVPAGEGRVVVWQNHDIVTVGDSGTAHWLLSDENLFDSGSIAPGNAFTFTFPGPGTYHYRCKNHLNMAGTITVTD